MRRIYLNKRRSILLSLFFLLFSIPTFISNLVPVLFTVVYGAFFRNLSVLILALSSFFLILYSFDSLYKIFKEKDQNHEFEITIQLFWFVLFLISLIISLVQFGPSSIIFFDY